MHRSENNEDINEKLPKYPNLRAVGFLIIQIPILFLLIVILGWLFGVLDSVGIRPNILVNLSNTFPSLHSGMWDTIFGTPLLIILDAPYWFVRKTIFIDEKGNFSIIRYFIVPAIIPICLAIIFYDAVSGTGIMRFDMRGFSDLGIYWLIVGLLVKAILYFLHKKFGEKLTNIFAIAIIAISFILIL